MSPTLMSLVILESVLTAAALVMFLYRGMLDMKEEDHLVLDTAESHLVREQASIRRKMTILGRYIKIIGITWTVLLVVIFGLWIAEGLNMI